MTSALLKLPQSLSRARKEERVEQILTELVRAQPTGNPSSVRRSGVTRGLQP